jgi:acyl-CoA oxidase
MTAEDILATTRAYYDFHTDPILVMDGSVGTLLTIHYNLCIGTLAKYAHQSGVALIINQLLRFDLRCVLFEMGCKRDANRFVVVNTA